MAAMPKWVIAVGAVALLAGLVTAGIWASRTESAPMADASLAGPSATPPVPSMPTPTPTPEIILWASDVCAARDSLISSVVEVAGSSLDEGTAARLAHTLLEGLHLGHHVVAGLDIDSNGRQVWEGMLQPCQQRAQLLNNVALHLLILLKHLPKQSHFLTIFLK